jgi:hypothetical protein
MIHEYKNTETYRSSEPEARKRLSQEKLSVRTGHSKRVHVRKQTSS